MTFDVADLNGDLLVDFIVGTSNELVWYENLGQGQTAANQQLIDLERPSITGILILDFDEDGDLDILSSANGEIDDHRGFALTRIRGSGPTGEESIWNNPPMELHVCRRPSML